MLTRLPEYVELGGDLSATYVYVANSHDGSMAVTAAVTPIRIVCANTIGAALRQAEHGVNARRTFRFRHTGNLQAKFAAARQVLGMTIDYQKQFKELADRMATEPMTAGAREACPAPSVDGRRKHRKGRTCQPRAHDRARPHDLPRTGNDWRHGRQQPRHEVGRFQNDRWAS
jgi:hypothetical protein